MKLAMDMSVATMPSGLPPPSSRRVAATMAPSAGQPSQSPKTGRLHVGAAAAMGAA